MILPNSVDNQAAFQSQVFAVSIGKHVGDNRPEQRALSYADLIALLTTHKTRARKDGSYITRPMREGQRSDENALPWQLAVFDIDEELPLDWEQQLLIRAEKSKLRTIITSTYSHTPATPKLRIWFLTSRPVEADEHPYLHRAIEKKLPFKCDPCMRKPSQPIFLPSCPAENLQYKFSRVFEGEALDVDAVLAEFKPEIEEAVRRKAERVQGVAAATGVRQPGGLIDWFNQHKDMAIEVQLERHGYISKSRSRWLAPNSKSGNAAVVIYENGLKSFHAPAHCALAKNGKQLDEFGVYCALEHQDDFKKASKAAKTWAIANGWTDANASLPAAAASTEGTVDFCIPIPAAEAIIRAHYKDEQGMRTLRYWQDEFHRYDGTHWGPDPKNDTREIVYAYGKKHSVSDVKKKNVEDVVDALRAFTNLSDKVRAPAWLEAQPTDPDPRILIPMSNGILNIQTRTLLPHSSRLFALNALPFAYEPSAPTPTKWEAFLYQIWPDIGDDESILLLQEWCGYCLTQRTEQQKGLLLIGPKRAGKGVIGRVLTGLLGSANIVSPTLASFGNAFGLQPLIRKQLALISDARLGGKADIHGVAENLLRITGEDQISIPRKYMEDFTATLAARIMVLTNELPRFTDGSGALPSRFLILNITESFYGREDMRLTEKLLTELPGIFNWALQGLDSLDRRGYFEQPAAGQELIDQLYNLASPVKAFLDEYCDISDPIAEIKTLNLFMVWKKWCEDNNYEHAGTQQSFGRNLRAAHATLGMVRHREHGAQIPYYTGIKLTERWARAYPDH